MATPTFRTVRTPEGRCLLVSRIDLTGSTPVVYANALVAYRYRLTTVTQVTVGKRTWKLEGASVQDERLTATMAEAMLQDALHDLKAAPVAQGKSLRLDARIVTSRVR